MNFKKNFLFIILAICFFTGKAQSTVSGKTFIAQTSTTCKDMAKGGCTLTNFCMLKFNKDNVEVTTYCKANCTDQKLEKNYERAREVKTYKWSQQKNTVRIEGFDDYGSLTLGADVLTGARGNGDEYEMVLFRLRSGKTTK